MNYKLWVYTDFPADSDKCNLLFFLGEALLRLQLFQKKRNGVQTQSDSTVMVSPCNIVLPWSIDLLIFFVPTPLYRDVYKSSSQQCNEKEICKFNTALFGTVTKYKLICLKISENKVGSCWVKWKFLTATCKCCICNTGFHGGVKKCLLSANEFLNFHPFPLLSLRFRLATSKKKLITA